MLSLLLQTGAAVVLLFAGAQKLANPTALRGTVIAVGLPYPELVACAAATIELATGAALVLVPGSPATATALAGLGMVFAGTGALALMRRIHVNCACLGAISSSTLGWRQIALLPGWILVAVVGVVEPSPLFAEERPELLTVLLLALTLGASIRAGSLAREHRTLRHLREAR